jgi:hypothetical protein
MAFVREIAKAFPRPQDILQSDAAARERFAYIAQLADSRANACGIAICHRAKLGDRSAVFGNDDPLASLRALQQFGEVRLGLVGPDFSHGILANRRNQSDLV